MQLKKGFIYRGAFYNFFLFFIFFLFFFIFFFNVVVSIVCPLLRYWHAEKMNNLFDKKLRPSVILADTDLLVVPDIELIVYVERLSRTTIKFDFRQFLNTGVDRLFISSSSLLSL